MIGLCFHYQTPPNDRHLFVVIAPSQQQQGWFICVNLTTKRLSSDASCEIRQEEHPAVLTSAVSVVNYAEAREMPLPLIQREAGRQQLAPMPKAVLQRIQQAALRPDSRIKNVFKKAIESYLNPPMALPPPPPPAPA